MCQAGTRYDGAYSCYYCEQGKYMDESSHWNTNCKDCSAGGITAFMGATVCTICAVGFFAKDRKACTPCNAGQFTNVAADSCST